MRSRSDLGDCVKQTREGIIRSTENLNRIKRLRNGNFELSDYLS